MRNQEEQSLKEAKRAGKRTAEEAERIAKEQERKKAYLAKEEAIEKAWQARKTKHAEERATEEIEQLPRNQADCLWALALRPGVGFVSYQCILKGHHFKPFTLIV